MKKGQQHTSPEAAERERRHQFGQPEGNKQCDPSKALNQRQFYAWVESQATLAELEAYLKDPSRPAARQRFIAVYLAAQEVSDFCQISNQTHGMPKQVVEAVTPPVIRIDLSGEDEELPEDMR